MERLELQQLNDAGYTFQQPWEVVDQFEKKIAEFFGVQYAVATDCCTHALELSFRLRNQPTDIVKVPVHTYMSIPMMLEKLNQPWQFIDQPWKSLYQFDSHKIVDAATLWEKDSYIADTLMCVSFQFKKHIPIGRGGIVLTDDYECYNQLQKMCRDGRDRTLLQTEDDITEIGYHYYMTPEDAARGILLFDQLHKNPGKLWSWKNYKQLTEYAVFKDRAVV
jgi:dTDP-4-amino-4,6-dideoxygalactose transaminase